MNALANITPSHEQRKAYERAQMVYRAQQLEVAAKRLALFPDDEKVLLEVFDIVNVIEGADGLLESIEELCSECNLSIHGERLGPYGDSSGDVVFETQAAREERWTPPVESRVAPIGGAA